MSTAAPKEHGLVANVPVTGLQSHCLWDFGPNSCCICLGLGVERNGSRFVAFLMKASQGGTDGQEYRTSALVAREKIRTEVEECLVTERPPCRKYPVPGNTAVHHGRGAGSRSLVRELANDRRESPSFGCARTTQMYFLYLALQWPTPGLIDFLGAALGRLRRKARTKIRHRLALN